MNISDVDGLQPSGYLVRIPFYILAERDAQIVMMKINGIPYSKPCVHDFFSFSGFH